MNETGGEQFSHFQLRGRAYPMWTREQGVGRNHSTFITKMAGQLTNTLSRSYKIFMDSVFVPKESITFPSFKVKCQ